MAVAEEDTDGRAVPPDEAVEDDDAVRWCGCGLDEDTWLDGRADEPLALPLRVRFAPSPDAVVFAGCCCCCCWVGEVPFARADPFPCMLLVRCLVAAGPAPPVEDELELTDVEDADADASPRA